MGRPTVVYVLVPAGLDLRHGCAEAGVHGWVALLDDATLAVYCAPDPSFLLQAQTLPAECIGRLATKARPLAQRRVLCTVRLPGGAGDMEVFAPAGATGFTSTASPVAVVLALGRHGSPTVCGEGRPPLADFVRECESRCVVGSLGPHALASSNVLARLADGLFALLFGVVLVYQLPLVVVGALARRAGINRHLRVSAALSRVLNRAEAVPRLRTNRSRLTHVLLDTALGLYLVYNCAAYVSSYGNAAVSRVTFRLVDEGVECLQSLVEWLGSSPAGLKLNATLCGFFGVFFLNLVAMWRDFLVGMVPFLPMVVRAVLALSALGGFSVMVALAIDLTLFLTLHVACFHEYAALFFSYQLRVLASLFRLFLGKKWNPLRSRVDTCSYDMDQLLLGTLLFTVTLFLLPTCAVFYVVFASLRLSIYLGHATLLSGLQVWEELPFYAILAACAGERPRLHALHFVETASPTSASGTREFSGVLCSPPAPFWPQLPGPGASGSGGIVPFRALASAFLTGGFFPRLRSS